jgi:signal transduction histidine kinase
MIFMLRAGLRRSEHRLFFLYLLGLAVWGVLIFGMRSSPSLKQAYQWELWLVPLAPLTASFLCHFSLTYTRQRIFPRMLWAMYGISLAFIPLSLTGLILTGMQMKPYGYAPIFGPAAVPWMAYSYILVTAALVHFIRAYRTFTDAEQRNRVAYISLGILILMLSGVFDVLPILGLPLYPGVIVGNIIFCLITTFAILRHNLLDIHVALRMSTAYALLSAVIALPVIGIFMLASRVVSDRPMPAWAYVSLLLVLALVLPRLWNRTQQWVDRMFYRDRYNYLRALERFCRDTHTLAEHEELGPTVVKLIAGALRPSSAYLLQPVPPRDDFAVVAASDGNKANEDFVFDSSSVLLRWLQRSDGIFSFTDLDFVPQLQGVIAREKEFLESLEAELIVPLKAPSGQLSALLILGQKASREPYSVEDRQLIYALGTQLAITLENARLYRLSQDELAERRKAEQRLERSRKELRALSTHLQSLREDERTHIAREIHDELGQSLTALKLDLSFLSKRLSTDDTSLVYQTKSMARLTDAIIRSVKRISTELRPVVLDELGLIAAVDWQTKEFERRTEIKCQLNIELADDNIPKHMATAVFRTFQETLTNISRHARATEVTVNMGIKEDRLILTVSDNGKGITDEKILSPGSLGILGMRERALSLKGDLAISGKKGKGTTVKLSIPFSRQSMQSESS